MGNSFSSVYNRVFEPLLLGCLFLTVLQTAVPVSVPLHELFLLTCLIAFAFTIRACSAKKLLSGVKGLFYTPSAVVFIIFTIIYISIDAVGLLYSPTLKYALTKYSVIVPMAMLSVLTWCCLTLKADAEAVYCAVTASGIGVSAAAAAIYFLSPERIYLRRISLIADYNQFAQTVFISFIIGIFLLWRSAFSYPCKLIASFIFTVINVTVLMLSGSRRTYLMLIPIGIITVCAIALYISKSCAPVGKTASVICFLSVCASAVLFSLFLCKGFIWFSDSRLNGGGANAEASVADVAESIGGLLENKRVVIWKTALAEALNYEKSDILLGKGSGYESYFYDVTADNSVNRLYPPEIIKPNWMHPHNQFLSDFLSGGLLRLTACITAWCTLGAICVLVTARRFMRGLPLLISAGIVFFNSLISGRYGFIYDKFFWLIAVFAVWELSHIKAGEA